MKIEVVISKTMQVLMRNKVSSLPGLIDTQSHEATNARVHDVYCWESCLVNYILTV